MTTNSDTYRIQPGSRNSNAVNGQSNNRTYPRHKQPKFADQNYVENFIKTFNSERTRNNDIAHFWQKLTQEKNRAHSFSDQSLRRIIDHTYEILNQLRMDELSLVACAYAKLHCDLKNSDEIKKSAIPMIAKANKFDSKALSGLARAFVLMRSNDPEFIEAIKTAITKDFSILNNFNNRDISCMVWAFANFEFNYENDAELLEAMKNVIAKELNNFNNMDLASALWAYTKFRCTDQKFINDLLEIIHNKLKAESNFKDTDIYKILWSIISLNKTDKYLRLIVNKIMTMLGNNSLDTHYLSKIMLSISTLEHTWYVTSFMSSLEVYAMQKIQYQRSSYETYGQDLANMLFALYKAKSRNENCILAIMQKFTQLIRDPNFSANGFCLSNSALTVAKLYYVDLTFVDSLRGKLADKIQDVDFFDKQALPKIADFIYCFGHKEDEEFLRNYAIAVKSKIDSGTIFCLNDLIDMSFSFILLGRPNEFLDIIKIFLQHIETGKNKVGISENEALKILRIYDVLLLKEKNIEIPWNERFIIEIESYRERFSQVKAQDNITIEDVYKFLNSAHINERIQNYCSIDPNEQITVKKFIYESGFIVDIAVFAGDRKIAIEVNTNEHYFMNSTILKQKYIRKIQILKDAGWLVIQINHNDWNCLQKGQKFGYIEQKFINLTAVEDVQSSFEDLAIQNNGGQEFDYNAQVTFPYGYQMAYMPAHQVVYYHPAYYYPNQFMVPSYVNYHQPNVGNNEEIKE